MAKVTYAPSAEQIAEGDLPKDTKHFGYEFVDGKSVDVTNEAHLRKFAGHPYFKVSGHAPAGNDVVRTAAERESAMLGASSAEVVNGKAVEGPRVDPVPSQPKQSPDKITPGQADKPDGDSELRAVHRGRGSYSVVEGEKDEEVLGGLSKDEAETFNNLSADEKAEYLKANSK